MLKLKNKLIQGTLILTIAGFITRFIGFAYRIFLSDAIGAKLLGVYQLIFPVYGICFTIYASGIQTAISQKIAANSILAIKAEYQNKRSKKLHTQKSLANFQPSEDFWICLKEKRDHAVLKIGLMASLSLAFLLSIFVFHFASPIATNLLLEPTCAKYLKILCILFPFCGISACINGYFYGKKEASVPATSQIVEQLVRVSLVGVLCTVLPVDAMTKSYFAVIGIVVGEFMASLYNVIRLILAFHAERKVHISSTSCPKRSTPYNTRSTINDIDTLTSKKSSTKKMGYQKLAFSLLFLSTTLTGTKLIISLLHSAESVFIPAALRQFGYSASQALGTYGMLSGIALPFILFPSAITNSFAVMLLPSIAQANASNQTATIRKYVSLSSKYSLYIGYFFSCTFLLFGHEFGQYLFHNQEAGTYITILSLLCPALYLSTTLSSIINGLGATQITFFITVISLGINIASLVFLVPKYGIIAYLIGSITSDYVMAGLEWIYLHSYIHVTIKEFLTIPLVVLCIFGGISKILYSFVSVGNSALIQILLVFGIVGVVAIVYVGVLYQSGCMRRK